MAILAREDRILLAQLLFPFEVFRFLLDYALARRLRLRLVLYQIFLDLFFLEVGLVE